MNIGIQVSEDVADRSPDVEEADGKHITWSEYCEWRKTKTPSIEDRALSIVRMHTPEIDELSQATHEFIGEVGEMLQLVVSGGDGILADEEVRKKLKDEIGDVVFTAMWAMQAWGLNWDEDINASMDYFGEWPDIREFFQKAIDEAKLNSGERGEALTRWHSALLTCAISASAYAMAIANYYKKLRYRSTPPSGIGSRAISDIYCCMSHVSAICSLCGISPEEPARSNMAKIDARWPSGVAINAN